MLMRLFCDNILALKLKNQLVSSLLSVSVELLRQQKELVSIINKKDKEIKDYKDNGAVISRSNERRDGLVNLLTDRQINGHINAFIG